MIGITRPTVVATIRLSRWAGSDRIQDATSPVCATPSVSCWKRVASDLGAHIWRGDTVTPVFVLGSRKLFDQTIQEIESGTVNRDGAVTLFFRGDGNAQKWRQISGFSGSF